MAGFRNFLSSWVVIAVLAAGFGAVGAMGQLPEPGAASQAPNPLTDSNREAGQDAALRS